MRAQHAPRAAFAAASQNTGDQSATAGRGLYESRDLVALVAAAVIVAVSAYAVNTLHIQQPEVTPEPVTVRLVELPETPMPQPTPEPLSPPPTEPQPPQPQPPAPKLDIPPPFPTPAPAVEVPLPTPTPVIQSPPAVVEAPPPAIQPPPRPVATPSPRSNAAAEGAYQARARSQIAKNKHYPDEAMQMSMTGSTHVVYVIDRDGNLIRVDVERSSGHSLLDQAALRAVRKTRFDPIPDDAWIDLKEQTFRTRIDFNIE